MTKEQQEAALKLANWLLNPEGGGFAVGPWERDMARIVVGLPPVECVNVKGDVMDEKRLTKYGRVTIEGGQITVEDFGGANTTCRDVAIMAAAWAIGELQREMLKTIERPGGGNIVVG